MMDRSLVTRQIAADLLSDFFALGEEQGCRLCWDADDVAAVATRLDVDQTAVLETLMLQLSDAFDRGAIDYDIADRMANDLWNTMISNVSEGGFLFSPAVVEMYEAFDGGEYHRKSDGADVDPVQKYTVPHVRQSIEIYGRPLVQSRLTASWSP